MNKERIVQVLDDIAADMKADATSFDGQPFTGRTVAEYFGNQGAAIAALANILRELVNEPHTVEPPLVEMHKRQPHATETT